MIEPEDNVAVTARGLSRSFGAVPAVRNVDFAVARGEIFGLVGPDGAGKSTIMRMLAGVLKPDAGDIHLEGVDVASRSGARQDLLELHAAALRPL